MTKKNRFEVLFNNLNKKLKFIDYLIKVLVMVIILFLLLEFISFIAVQVYEDNDSRFYSEVYSDKEWAELYFKEFKDSFEAEYYPYVGYRRVPNFKGEFINLDENSIRKTENNCSDSDTIKIFVFGGSTIWGTGARDIGTIPSYLAKDLCESFSVEITNFGESGYTSSQEVIRLILELRNGNVPDVVVFYDGVNDVYSSYQNNVAGVPQNIENRKADFNSRKNLNIKGYLINSNFMEILKKVVKTSREKNLIEKGLSSSLSDETTAIYLNNVKIVKILEKEYGFKSLFYWQPAVYTKNELSGNEKDEINLDMTFGGLYLHVTDGINNSDSVVDLTGVFNVNKTIFIDDVHISEDGNEIIAKVIAEDIRKVYL